MTSASQPSSPARVRRWWSGRVVWLVLVGAGAVVWLLSGFYTVGTDEQGVVTRFGRTQGNMTRPPGLHYALPWPIDRVYTPRTTEVRRINVGFTTLGTKSPLNRRSDMLTGDQNILKMMMVVQYKIRNPVTYLFQAEHPHWLVERTVESAMSQLVAARRVDDVLTTAKGEIQVRAIRIAQGLLDSYNAGIALLGANLQVVDPPIPVMDAFKDVASAKKDAERTIDEAREDESRILPEARGLAQGIISRAQGIYAERVNWAEGDADRFLNLLAEYRIAKDITRTRLYVDTMERVFSKMEVVILDRTDGESGPKITIVDQ